MPQYCCGDAVQGPGVIAESRKAEDWVKRAVSETAAPMKCARPPPTGHPTGELNNLFRCFACSFVCFGGLFAVALVEMS